MRFNENVKNLNFSEPNKAEDVHRVLVGRDY